MNLEFEKPILELEGKIAELRNMSGGGAVNIAEEIGRMTNKADKLLQQTYSKLTPAQKVQVARHPERPHFLDYIREIITDFTPLAGDRNFSEDYALLGGLGRFKGRSVVVMGHEKGFDTETRIKHNFGMTRPEGYRKAQRLMNMASQFQLPIITLVDTAGAYPGKGAEERGQSEAIAKSIETCLRTDVPIVSVIIGEGGSGGAIAIAVADRVYMLEHSIYSVISPEGCASILWRSAAHAEEAATALKITAQDLYQLKLVDGIIGEPIGGAHRHKKETIANVSQQIEKALNDLTPWDPSTLLQSRRKKFLAYSRNF
ncbi:MAG TPA: acetyl-CoA carboxylase carboxyltransferase subunit alpha [Alphaproteobacteria bacterium]|jgi:acetyl-CoA carboxylase carboxyl transferase subunit alpha|nr:acetyl-CoA carboxylase carboxyltransferase subunit alpha [Micavibrio sp.]MBK9563188.1 acetyl-CoA carboxylase carboxyltransferase subunit alpha [Micavibrio sp.]HQX26539.1 acetyl-CoA carboxylase carboxyltransferase subunit alpha [Alphaproteobacteria bacterium]